MLRDAHSEEDADAVGGSDLVGDGDERRLRDAGDLFGVFERERLERGLVLLEVVDPLGDELSIVQVVIEDVFGHAVEPCAIG